MGSNTHACRSSGFPSYGDSAIRQVNAVGAGTNRTIEVVAQRGVVLSDPGQRVAHRACDGTSRTFGTGTGAPVTTSQSDGPGQFALQEVAFDLPLRSSIGVAERVRFREVLVDLSQPAAICSLRLRVQQFASIVFLIRRPERKDPARPVQISTLLRG